MREMIETIDNDGFGLGRHQATGVLSLLARLDPDDAADIYVSNAWDCLLEYRTSLAIEA